MNTIKFDDLPKNTQRDFRALYAKPVPRDVVPIVRKYGTRRPGWTAYLCYNFATFHRTDPDATEFRRVIDLPEGLHIWKFFKWHTSTLRFFSSVYVRAASITHSIVQFSHKPFNSKNPGRSHMPGKKMLLATGSAWSFFAWMIQVRNFLYSWLSLDNRQFHVFPFIYFK